MACSHCWYSLYHYGDASKAALFILWCRCLSEMSHRSLALKSSTVMYRRYCLTARCSGPNLMFSWQLLNLCEATALAYPRGQIWTTAPEFFRKESHSRFKMLQVSSRNEISGVWTNWCLSLIYLPPSLTIRWMDDLLITRKHQGNNTGLWILTLIYFLGFFFPRYGMIDIAWNKSHT